MVDSSAAESGPVRFVFRLSQIEIGKKLAEALPCGTVREIPKAGV